MARSLDKTSSVDATVTIIAITERGIIKKEGNCKYLPARETIISIIPAQNMELIMRMTSFIVLCLKIPENDFDFQKQNRTTGKTIESWAYSKLAFTG